MKKILFVAHVQSHIMNFHIPYIQKFIDEGNVVHVVTKLDLVKYKEVMINDSNLIWYNVDFERSPIAFKNLKALSQLIRIMRLNEYDLVHVHTPVGGVLGRIAGRITNTSNIVYTAHGFHFYKGASLSKWLIYYPIEKIMAKYTDKIITINEEDYQIAKNKFQRGQFPQVFKVDGVGIDLDKYSLYLNEYDFIEKRKEMGLNNEDFVLTVVAELIERKNHRQLIDAIDLLREKYEDIKVVFVGDGELREYLQDIVNLKKLEYKVKFLGFRHDVENIIAISDVVCLFSYHEGLPKNLMEAMVAGKPIIASNVRGNRDLVIHNKNGLLVDINDIQATVCAVETLYSSPTLCKSMGNESKRLIKKYEINKIVNDVNRIYNI